MKIKLLTLTTLTLSFLLSAPPIAWGLDYCYFPNGNSWSWFSNCSSCESIGYKLNYQDRSGLICMDSNCVAGKRTGDETDDVGCQKCSSGFYVDSKNNFCMICPQGATCDGYTFTCSDGYSTVLPATAELICPAVNVLTVLPMRYVTDRLIFPAIRAISNQTANVSKTKKRKKNRQRQTRSTLVRRA